MIHQTFIKAAGLTVLTLVFVACGGGGGTDVVGGSGSSPSASPVEKDSFFAAVIEVIASSTDAAEPREIDSITVTAPENSETLPLDS